MTNETLRSIASVAAQSEPNWAAIRATAWPPGAETKEVDWAEMNDLFGSLTDADADAIEAAMETSNRVSGVQMPPAF